MKKRKDGRLQKSFLFNEKRYYVYGKTPQELSEKEFEKRKKLEEGIEDRENPTLNSYYDRFTEYRRNKIKEATYSSGQEWTDTWADADKGDQTI